MPMVATSTQLGTPVRLPTDRPQQVTVTDPAHPLYGRTFAVVAPASTIGASGQVTVAYRGDILLKIPVMATSLDPTSPCLTTSKLSADSVRELVRVAREFLSCEKQGRGFYLDKEYLIIDEGRDLQNTVNASRDKP
jgi:hypothetical protein